MLDTMWYVVLLNGLQVRRHEHVIDRFRTQKTGELLAFLALHRQRSLPREEVAGIVWPDSDVEAGRASLRTALASLRQQLEPPGAVANSVVVADRVSVRLNPDALTTDVAEFEAACQVADSASVHEQRLQAGLEAIRVYGGDLLPGCYADWILSERSRLAQNYVHQLRQVIRALQDSGQSGQALPYAHRLLAANPYEEEDYLLIMRVCAEAQQPGEALHFFEQWKQLSEKALGAPPSQLACSLAGQIRENIGGTPRRVATRAFTDRIFSPRALATERSARLARTTPRNTPATEATIRTGAESASVAPSARLPLPLTRFFGRDTEITQVARLLSPSHEEWVRGPTGPAHRLVTLTGPGGTGKTRLAIEVARRLHAQAALPVTFVSLADISDPSRILEAVAHALKLPMGLKEDLVGGVVAALAELPQAIILDNFEQLLFREGAEAAYEAVKTDKDAAEETGAQGAVQVVQSLLERVPTLVCLITSRQCLNLEGEQEFPVHPLPTPAHAGTPERLLDFASVELFVNRAQLSRPDFQLTPRNMEVVGSLCAQLEGLPLAIELAAAWVSILSPAKIQARLSNRLDLLIGRKSGRVSRHQSLRAAIEWSYQLLSPDLQRLFTRLAVFRGGWTVEAAQQVCEEPNALECLRTLRDHSLLLSEESDDQAGETRFRLLETLREFAAEQLKEEEWIRLRHLHLDWCLNFAQEAAPHLVGAEQTLWLQRLAVEQENIREALERCLHDAASMVTGLDLLFTLRQYWNLRGNYAEVRRLLDRFLSRLGAQEPTLLRIRGLDLAAHLALYQSDWTEAAGHMQQALQIARQIGNAEFVARQQVHLGTLALQQGELESAQRYFDEGLPYYEAQGDPLYLASMYSCLGDLAEARGNYAEGAARYVQALESSMSEQNLSGMTYYSRQLGLLYTRLGETQRARFYLAQSLEGYLQLGDIRGMAECLCQIGTRLPISAASVRLAAAGQALNAATSAGSFALGPYCEQARLQLGGAVFEAAWTAGAAWTPGQALLEAQNLLRDQPIIHTALSIV